jgi:hypothetical protein
MSQSSDQYLACLLKDTPTMEYETIEIEIGPGNGSAYPVAVRSLAGEAHAIMQFPFDEFALENRLLNLQNSLLRSGGQRRQVLSPEQNIVQRFGHTYLMLL